MRYQLLRSHGDNHLSSTRKSSATCQLRITPPTAPRDNPDPFALIEEQVLS